MKKQILLIDSLGALLSAILLLLTTKFEYLLGIPKALVFSLAPIPIAFCIYSGLAYFFGKNYWKSILKIIALANLLYCALTVYLIIAKKDVLTNLGVLYFIIEIIIVAILAFIELRIARKPDS